MSFHQLEALSSDQTVMWYFSSGNMLAAHVHPNLVEPAGNLCTNVEAFGGAIEKLLIKHGKNIIHEQFLLNRIAQV